MLVKKKKLNNVVHPFGRSGQVIESFKEKFRSFSVYNNAGNCVVTVMGTAMSIPAGVTVTWDAPTEESVVNVYQTDAFDVNAQDCIVAGTI